MDPRITAITDEFFFIQRGWLNANHLVFTGGPKTLIDTAYIRDKADTEALINQCGLAIEEVELIFNTHAHCDHIGGNAEFQRRSGCQIVLHEVDRYNVDQKNAMATWSAYYQQEAEFFPTHGTLIDGSVITLGDMDFLVMHTPWPRHGPDRALRLGDRLADQRGQRVGRRFRGAHHPHRGPGRPPFRLRDSLERLSRLNVKRIFPGHGPILEDGPAAIEACLARVGAFIAEPKRMGRDQVRKIMLYTMMMRGPQSREDLWQRLHRSPWFPETAELYFGGRQEATFAENLEYLLGQGLVKRDDGGKLVCTLPA